MANGPHDYRDPKVTTTERRSSMSWLWWLIGLVLLLLVLGWLLGWFGRDDVAATVTEPAASEETATTGGTATEGTATGGTAAEGTATDAAD